MKPLNAVALRLVPITFKAACAFITAHHRHHKPSRGCVAAFAVAREVDGVIVGVALSGRPIARRLDDGWTLEVTRVATDGTPGACSMLYTAAAKDAKARGYTTILTYTLDHEDGASLRGASWICDGNRFGGGQWSQPSRGRAEHDHDDLKKRWRCVLGVRPSWDKARS